MAQVNVSSRYAESERNSPAFWLLYLALFAVFLTVAVSAALLTIRWRGWLPGAEGERSLIGGVRSAVYTAISHVI